MKRARFLIVVFVVLALAVGIVVLMCQTLYQRVESIGDVHIVTKNDEAYVFIQIRTGILTIPRFEYMVARTTGIVRQDHKSWDGAHLYLIHIAGESAALHDLGELGVSVIGTIVPYEDRMYLLHGGYQRGGFVLNDFSLARLSTAELRQIDLAIAEGRAEAESWNVEEIWDPRSFVDESRGDATLKIGESAHNLTISTNRAKEAMQVGIRLSNGTKVDFITIHEPTFVSEEAAVRIRYGDY